MSENTGPGRKTVFKVNTGKIPYSQNTQECCIHCYTERPPGAKPFPLCSGCRAVRYCTKEHQRAAWPDHKSFCKAQQRLKSFQAAGPPLPEHNCGMPSPKERQWLIEDWVRLHDHSIDQALAHAVKTSPFPVDFHKHHAFFNASYRKDCGGNPSTAFILNSVKILDNPPPTDPLSMMITTFVTELDKSHEEDKQNNGYSTVLPCVYAADEVVWTTATYLYEPVPRGLLIKNSSEWFEQLKYFVDKGVVFRLLTKSNRVWTAGVMGREGKDWVWRQKSPRELDEIGISSSNVGLTS